MRKSFTHPNKLWKSFTLRRVRNKALNLFCSERCLWSPVRPTSGRQWVPVSHLRCRLVHLDLSARSWGGGCGGLETPSRQPLLSLQGKLRPRQGYARDGVGGTLPICHRTGHLPRSSLRPPQHPPLPPSH